MDGRAWLGVILVAAAALALTTPGCGEEFSEPAPTPTGGSGGTTSSTTTANGGSGGNTTCVAYGDACTECALQSCPEDYCACEGNPACNLLANCLDTCETGYNPCVRDCYAMSPTGISDGALVLHCAGEHCSTECPMGETLPGCNECMFRSCSLEMDDCLSVEECAQLVFCGLGCAWQEPTCVQDCFTTHSGAAADGTLVWSCLKQDCADACPWAADQLDPP